MARPARAILEERPAQPDKSVQWTDLSDKRRELERAAGPQAPVQIALDGPRKVGHDT
jgi:hypothetical protein